MISLFGKVTLYQVFAVFDWSVFPVIYLDMVMYLPVVRFLMVILFGNVLALMFSTEFNNNCRCTESLVLLFVGVVSVTLGEILTSDKLIVPSDRNIYIY